MLVLMGVQIEGIGFNMFKIYGVDKFSGCEFIIGVDYLEVGSFIGFVVCTDLDIVIRNVGCEYLRMILMIFEKFGIKVEYVGDDDLWICLG